MNAPALFDELARLFALKIGIRIADDTRERFIQNLLERASRCNCASLADYRGFLAGPNASREWENLARLFSSGETFFFRDHGQFDLLRLRLLPELVARNNKTLRLWSAGCASGEEAYSLAMLVDMLLPEREDWSIVIAGTDIDSDAIARARRGRYGQWSFRMVPQGLQQRYFRHENAEWVVDERIRNMVNFSVSNLVDAPFPDAAMDLHDMDLILCRNVFIYFDPVAVTAVAAKLAATLRKGGYLLTAHTELIGFPVPELESRLFAEGVAYQRRGATRPQPVEARPLPSRVTTGAPPVVPSVAVISSPSQLPVLPEYEELFRQAQAQAETGEFDLAGQTCRKALSASPLAAPPYFLLAQLAQLKGDSGPAMEYLNKAIYLDPGFAAAYLELAALYERGGNLPRALTLRRAALEIVRSLPKDQAITPFETTAGELAEWLVQ